MENWVTGEIQGRKLSEVQLLPFRTLRASGIRLFGVSNEEAPKKGLVEDAAFGTVVTVDFAGPMPSLFEAMCSGE